MPKSRTAPSTPRLSEYARKFTFPTGIHRTVWPRVEAKGAELGLGFDWWQSQLGTVCLGYGEDGKYVATIGGVGLSIPRQVGKTYFVLATLVILCILFPGLQVVWTAHHLRTSTKTFTTLRGICRRKKVAPHIAVDGRGKPAIRSSNGEQEVVFRNGSKIMFGARSMGFGRGFDEIDIEVFDEAQILDTKSLEDMIAATNQARHEHGALLFYMGTPPRPTDPSDAFTSRRADAWSGEADDAIWLEMGADPDSDPDDRSQWPLMNPSYPKRTPLESMLRLRKNLADDDSWNREGRGVWDSFDENDDRPIPLDAWNNLKIEDSAVPQGSPDRYALAMSPERVASIAVSLSDEAGDYVDLAELSRVDDSRKLIDWLVERCGRKIPVMIDSRDPAASFINELRSRGVKVNATTQADAGKACGGLLDAVTERRVRHCGQPAIRTALAVVQRRDIGKAGLWEFNPDDPLPEIAALRALTLAHYGLSFKKPTSAAYAF